MELDKNNTSNDATNSGATITIAKTKSFNAVPDRVHRLRQNSRQRTEQWKLKKQFKFKRGGN